MCVTVSGGESHGQEESCGWRNQGEGLGALMMWEAVTEDAGMDWDELGIVVMEAVVEGAMNCLQR